MGHQNHFAWNLILLVQIIPPFTISRLDFTQIVIGLISTSPTMATLSMDYLPLIFRILLYLKCHGTHFVPTWILRWWSLIWVLTSTKLRQRCSSPSSSTVSRIQSNTHYRTSRRLWNTGIWQRWRQLGYVNPADWKLLVSSGKHENVSFLLNSAFLA